MARNLATRLRNWVQDAGALDENQAGFGQARSTADATHIFVRLQEDAELSQLSDSDYKYDSNTNRAQTILLDPKKAYPRVKQTYVMGNSEHIWTTQKHHKQAEGST